MSTAKQVDEFEFRHRTDPENFFLATLFKDAIGLFRVVTMSGFNSVFGGAGNIGQRLVPSEVESWTDFGRK